jgi:hypothetical protein
MKIGPELQAQTAVRKKWKDRTRSFVVGTYIGLVGVIEMAFRKPSSTGGGGSILM